MVKEVNAEELNLWDVEFDHDDAAALKVRSKRHVDPDDDDDEEELDDDLVSKIDDDDDDEGEEDPADDDDEEDDDDLVNEHSDDPDDDEEEEDVEDDEDDDDELVNTATTKEPKMTDTTGTARAGATKANAIRDAIKRRQASGDSLRPKDIIAELAKSGMVISASQVSVTLRALGVPPGPRGRKKGDTTKPKGL